MKLEKIFQLFDAAFRAFELILFAAGAIAVGALAWAILSIMGVAMLLKIAGTAAGALVGALLAWLIWTVMKLLH